jgi:CHAD domain-containing protein
MNICWSDRRSVRKNVQALLPDLVEEYFTAGRHAMNPKRTWRDMHKFRLATKRFRYTLELFRPVYADELEARLDSVRKIQQFLGDINDAATMREVLADLKGMDSLLEQLGKKAESKRKSLHKYWQGLFDAPGELEAWKIYLVEGAAPPKKLEQKVGSGV